MNWTDWSFFTWTSDRGLCYFRSTCTLSHDIHTPVNMQVLKNHGLFGLNEAQLRILLLQNDPCLLPEVSHQGVTLMSHSLQVLSPICFSFGFRYFNCFEATWFCFTCFKGTLYNYYHGKIVCLFGFSHIQRSFKNNIVQIPRENWNIN